MYPQDCFLMLCLHYDRDPNLDYGLLRLISLDLGDLLTLKCTSSTVNRQQRENFHLWGGMLPPDYRVPGLNRYLVETKPKDLRHIKGVESNFYKINPHRVVTDGGKVRSDFGIHLDANVPGSLGCPVMSADRFAKFEEKMAIFPEYNMDVLPMFCTIT